MLTKYQKAKRKWFYKNVINFEIFLSSSSENIPIVRYVIGEDIELCYISSVLECQLLYRACKKLEPWQIYYKYKNALSIDDSMSTDFSEARLVFNCCTKRDLF